MILDIKTALSIASMIELTDSKANTIALGLIKIEVKGDTLTATATDRYVLGQMVIPIDNTDNEDFIVYWDKDTVKYLKDRAKVITDIVQTAPYFVDNTGTYIMPKNIEYPKVDTLFETLETRPLAEPINVNLSFFTRVSKILTPEQARRTPAQRTKPIWTMLSTGQTDNAKPRPLLLTNEDSSVRVLLQPSLRRA